MAGFFEGYEASGGLSYISKEEKATLAKNETQLTVHRAWFAPTGGFEGKPGYKLVVTYDGGEERGLSFGAGAVQTRDELIDFIIEKLDVEEQPDELPVVFMQKYKQAILLKPVV